MTRWRIGLHALDRTGPPMLALAAIRAIRHERPDVDVEVVAFRGGPLRPDLERLAPTHVMLLPDEAWCHESPDPDRRAAVSDAVAAFVEPVDAVLLVSVAAGQILPYLPNGSAPVVAWVVETGEDLHWLDGPLALRDRVTAWWAGSEGTRAELNDHSVASSITVVPEFVETPTEPERAHVERVRTLAGARADDLLVVGAGIATFRKAPDLFLELAVWWRRTQRSPARFVWIGGQDDPLRPHLVSEAERLSLDHLCFLDSMADLTPWFAAADVVAHPARFDAFPLVALHAAAVGTPVVGFAGRVGLTQMFGDAFEGADYPDIAGLGRHLAAFVDAARRSSVGAAHRAIVRDRYSEAAVGPVLVATLDRVAGDRSRR